MKRSTIVAMLLCLCGAALISQDRTPPRTTGLKGAYLGLKPPGLAPEVFAPGIVSTPAAWEAAISFAPDGTELFFTRRLSIQGNENRILHMQLRDGSWTAPGPAPFARDLVEYEAFVAPDGKTIFYNSGRPRPGGAVGEIWYSERAREGWSEGRYLSDVINRGWVMFVTAARNNTLYFTAGYNRKFGIYRSLFRNGSYQEPEFLPDEVNAVRGAHPFIAPDERYLIFDAQPDGMGKSQLFVSFRTSGDNWTKAVKFDATVNATSTESIPNVGPDGKYFFFHRNNDIYWVDARIIDRMR